MLFSDIKGHDDVVRFLSGAIARRTVAPAYLFSGPRGIGKYMTARAFAQALNCLAPRGTDACGICAACVKMHAGNHPDLMVVAPEKEGASVRIEAIRALIANVGLRPFEGRYKVYIIDGADALTGEAANALLKTLEEPSPAAVVIIIAENSTTLFDTIVSRTQVVRFSALDIATVVDILVRTTGIPEARARMVAQLSAGRLGDALTMVRSDFLKHREALIEALVNRQFVDSAIEAAPKAESPLLLEVIASWYRDIIAVQAGVDPAALMNSDRSDALIRQARSVRPAHAERIIRQTIETSVLLSHHVNQKLALGVLGLAIREGKG